MHGQYSFCCLAQYFAGLDFNPGVYKSAQDLTGLALVFDTQAAFAGLSHEG